MGLIFHSIFSNFNKNKLNFVQLHRIHFVNVKIRIQNSGFLTCLKKHYLLLLMLV